MYVLMVLQLIGVSLYVVAPFADMNRASLQFDQFKKQEKDEIAESGEPLPAPQPPRQKSQPRQQSERRKKQ